MVKKMGEKNFVIAVTGKGGVGKTSTSAMIAAALLGRGGKILLIDADPVMGLVRALGMDAAGTVAGIRRAILEQSREERQRDMVASSIDYWLLEALEERPGYSLLAMGASEEPGCYCPLNKLVREAIKELAVNFDCIVIDGEAGIEQINREVMEGANVLLIISDASMRGLKTARMIYDKIDQGRIRPEKAALILNRVEDQAAVRRTALEVTGLEPIAILPEDTWIQNFDREGKSLLELPGECRALEKVRSALRELLPDYKI